MSAILISRLVNRQRQSYAKNAAHASRLEIICERHLPPVMGDGSERRGDHRN
jgi:hypothetical protein